MSVDVSFAMSNMSLNDGVHKLPKDCYPPTESESEDGEESFVVLDDPDSSFIGVVAEFEPPLSTNSSLTQQTQTALSPASIDRSLNMLNDMTMGVLNQSTMTLQSLPSTSMVMMMQSAKSNQSAENSLVDNNAVMVNGQELNLTQIQTRVHTLWLENAQLKEAVKQNNIAMKDQCEKIVILQEEYKKSTEQGKAKLQENINLVKQFEKENGELIFVRNEQKKLISQLQTDITLLNKNKEELKVSKEALDKISMANMKSFELESTERKLKEVLISWEQAVQNGENIQGRLNSLEKKSENIKLKHFEEIARLKEKLYDFHKKEEQYEQTENDKVTITNQMTEMQMKIVEMNARMTDLSTQNCVLEEHVKIYHTDFQEEREARQKLKQEEDQLKCDLEFTRGLNETLKEENARLKTPNAPIAPKSKESVSQVYVCQWCQFGFFNLNALSNHMQRCPEAFEQV